MLYSTSIVNSAAALLTDDNRENVANIPELGVTFPLWEEDVTPDLGDFFADDMSR